MYTINNYKTEYTSLDEIVVIMNIILKFKVRNIKMEGKNSSILINIFKCLSWVKKLKIVNKQTSFIFVELAINE